LKCKKIKQNNQSHCNILIIYGIYVIFFVIISFQNVQKLLVLKKEDKRNGKMILYSNSFASRKYRAKFLWNEVSESSVHFVKEKIISHKENGNDESQCEIVENGSGK